MQIKTIIGFLLTTNIFKVFNWEKTKMAYIYMDESWDLTFWAEWNNSKYFVISFLITKTEKDAEIIMKNFYKWTNWRWKKIKWAFFHSTKESIRSIKRILDLTSRRDMNIVSIIIDKTKISSKEIKNIHALYNKLAWELLQLCEKRWILLWWKHYFIASRKETNNNLKQELIKSLNNSHSTLLNIEVTIDIPQHKKWLEIVDACSHAIFKKYENWDYELYSVIKNKIILEKQKFN